MSGSAYNQPLLQLQPDPTVSSTALTALHPATDTDYTWPQVLNISQLLFSVLQSHRSGTALSEGRARVLRERHSAVVARQQAETAAPSHQNLMQTEHSSCTHAANQNRVPGYSPPKNGLRRPLPAPPIAFHQRCGTLPCFKTFLTAAPMGTATLGGPKFLPRAALLYSSFSNSSSLATCAEQQCR